MNTAIVPAPAQQLETAKMLQELSVNNLHLLYLIILDESNSMEDYKYAVIQAYNEMIDLIKQSIEQQVLNPILVKAIMQRIRICLCTFDIEYRQIYGYTTLDQIQPIGANDYKPENGGCTAIDKTANSLLGNSITIIKNKEISSNIAFYCDLYTDGEDNSSAPTERGEVRSHVSTIKEFLPGPHHFQITDFGNGVNAKMVQERLGFDQYRQMVLSTTSIHTTMTNTGRTRGTEFTTSFTDAFNQ